MELSETVAEDVKVTMKKHEGCWLDLIVRAFDYLVAHDEIFEVFDPIRFQY